MLVARVRLEDMVRGAEILVLSTHNAEALMDWCTRLIWMEQGRIHRDGPTEAVLADYLNRPGFVGGSDSEKVER